MVTQSPLNDVLLKSHQQKKKTFEGVRMIVAFCSAGDLAAGSGCHLDSTKAFLGQNRLATGDDGTNCQ